MSDVTCVISKITKDGQNKRDTISRIDKAKLVCNKKNEQTNKQ